MEDEIVWFSLSAFALCIVVIAQQGYDYTLWHDSLEFIPRLQEDASKTA